jgi:PKD repeat protein
VANHLQAPGKLFGAYLFFLVLFSITILPAVAGASVANFTGTLMSGPVPLTISSTDLSSGSPAGWAWFFGDENYTAPWTPMTGNTGWLGKDSQSSVAMPDGSIATAEYNDVWRSLPGSDGAIWIEVNTIARWSARDSYSNVVRPNSSIVLMDGETPPAKNDVCQFQPAGSNAQNPVHTYTGSVGQTFNVAIQAYNSAGYNNTFKSNYITITNPSVNIYPIPSPDFTRYLPNSNTNLPSPGLSLSQNTTPGEYEASSFIAQPQTAVTDMTVLATPLTSGSNTIPASEVDFKGVKAWWMPTNFPTNQSDYNASMGQYLIPELLLNDLSILNVSLVTPGDQTLRISFPNGTVMYFPLNATTVGNFPTNANIFDNATATGQMQPFAVPAGSNQQIWITTNVSAGTPPGVYTGQIWVNSSATTPLAMNFTVTVLPYTLPTPSLKYGIYFTHRVGVTDPASWSPDNGSFSTDQIPAANCVAELTDMKNHGVLYPMDIDSWDNLGTSSYAGFERGLQLRNQIGLPTDVLYTRNGINSGYYFAISPSDLNTLAARVKSAENQISAYGFKKLYLYGQDEPTSAQLISEIPAFTTEYLNGSYPYYAADRPGVDLPAINVTSLLTLSGATNTTDMGLYRALNPSIPFFRYGDPQSGVPNPEVYRSNFGLGLWKDGYSGAMDWAYMNGYGQSIWNDFDSPNEGGWYYSEENFVYPKSDGVIDTIQWEGLREGIDDTRYADLLTQGSGSRTAAINIINSGITAGSDMSTVRAGLINAISLTLPPTASFTGTPTLGANPLTVKFNDTSASSAILSSWYWMFGDGTISTLQNVSHTYTTQGIYTINFSVTNIYGMTSWLNQTNYITVGSPVYPLARFTVTPSTGDEPLTVWFSDLSLNSPSAWNWSFGDGTFSIAENPSHLYKSSGFYTVNLTVANGWGSNVTSKSNYIMVF